MRRRVAILDTSFYCCWLKVPGKETTGSGADAWDFGRVDAQIKEAIQTGSTIILPLATIIETGNHIAQAAEKRFEAATALCRHLKEAIGGQSPWVPFRDQSSFWDDEQLNRLVDVWPRLATAHMSFGDATIKHVADYYAAAGFQVRIFTADAALRAYEPMRPTSSPRRARQHSDR